MSGGTRRKPGWRKKLLALAVASLLALLACELIVRGFVPVRNVGPSFTVYDPIYGKRLKKSFTRWWIAPEFRIRFTTNSLGFRGPEPDSPPRGVVLFLGDSFTMGHGVSDGQEFPTLVRRRLEEATDDGSVPVVNAGVGYTGNGRWIKLLREEAGAYRPHAVILQVSSNDLGDNEREALFKLQDDGRLIELPIPKPSALRRIQGLVEAIPGLPYSHLFGLFKQVALRTNKEDPGSAAGQSPAPGDSLTDSAPAKLTFTLIEQSIAICREQGWPVLLLSADLDDPLRQELERRGSAAGVPLIKIPSKRERPDLYFKVDGHWNAAGHRYVAERVTEALLARLSGAAATER